MKCRGVIEFNFFLHYKEMKKYLFKNRPLIQLLFRHFRCNVQSNPITLSTCLKDDILMQWCKSFIKRTENCLTFSLKLTLTFISTHTLQARKESNLRKILQKNRRCHFEERDSPIWKLVLFSFFIGVQARSPISQLRDEVFTKFQKWQFSTLRNLINEHTQLFSKLSQCWETVKLLGRQSKTKIWPVFKSGYCVCQNGTFGFSGEFFWG